MHAYRNLLAKDVVSSGLLSLDIDAALGHTRYPTTPFNADDTGIAGALDRD